VVGQLIALSPPGELASVVHVAPPLFEKCTNERPVAKHTLVVGQLTPLTS
jgi:hypothetical protein